ncbi:MAG: membrane protein insertase YidC, partial [Spirochaetaceae bacterium]|nr:membrane protein insertase YidC [Spirochaetaceae bacterium]
MLDAIFTIIIYPIKQFIEVVYVVAVKVFENQVFAIAGVSLAVTFLCLPLYFIAERWQQVERNTQKRLKPKIDKIKTSFTGDEQYMILRTLYRQNHYHPMYSLRNSFGILIQIPFFIAAYSYLSHLESLQGASFMFINDMSKPDALFSIFGIRINILPVIMTLINCASGAIYTHKLAAKDKIQIYGMAVIFLILLYNSPAGLVLYWTINNVLSLVKNIFYKLKNPKQILYVLIAALMLLFIAYLLFVNNGKFAKRLFLSGICFAVLLTPILLKIIKLIESAFLVPVYTQNKQRTTLFFLSCITITVLLGLCTPASIIASSPAEFSYVDKYTSPFPFIASVFLQTFGVFGFWLPCVYFLFGKRTRSILTVLISFAGITALLDTFFFYNNHATISNTFIFDSWGGLNSALFIDIVNALVIMAVFVFLLFLFRLKKLSHIILCTGMILFSLSGFSVYNCMRINSAYKRIASQYNSAEVITKNIKPIFSLSKDKPNIIIVMADLALNGLVKPIFNEHPQLRTQFDGFTWYPNTLSFGGHTIFGVPAIWGGYEYSPQEMNKRADVPRVEKHNEALLVLPRILAGSGFEVTVTDPSWANYTLPYDVSIYDKYENITAVNLRRRYTSLWYAQHGFSETQFAGVKIKRNALWFSLLKAAPSFIRPVIYDDGWYWNLAVNQSLTELIDDYAILDFLPQLTTYDSKISSAILFTTELTHIHNVLLQYPNYVPAENVTNRGNSDFVGKGWIEGYYDVNSALYLKIGEWIDALKTNGVYDNTRIIIVSDHG